MKKQFCKTVKERVEYTEKGNAHDDTLSIELLLDLLKDITLWLFIMHSLLWSIEKKMVCDSSPNIKVKIGFFLKDVLVWCHKPNSMCPWEQSL